MLHELRFTWTWDRAKQGILVTREIFDGLLTRCFSASTGGERRDALFALDAIKDWHPECIKVLKANVAELSNWLTEIDEEYAVAFADFINQVGQRDRELTKSIMTICVGACAVARRRRRAGGAES